MHYYGYMMKSANLVDSIIRYYAARFNIYMQKTAKKSRKWYSFKERSIFAEQTKAILAYGEWFRVSSSLKRWLGLTEAKKALPVNGINYSFSFYFITDTIMYVMCKSEEN